MNIQDWGAIGEIVSGIAVVLSLIYVATQIRANTLQVKTQNYDSVTRLFGDWYNMLATNPQANDVYHRGIAGEELDDEEYRRFRQIMRSQAAIYETIFIHHEQGLYVNEDRYLRHLETYRTVLSSPGAREWWEHEKRYFYKGYTSSLSKKN